MPIIETALHYRHDLGLNVLPVKVYWNSIDQKYDKKPLIPWIELQTRQTTDDEIRKWWGNDYPDAGIAAVVGSISGGVVVIDCDSQQAVDELESLLPDSLIVPCSKSISGARHYFFTSDKPLQKKGRFYHDMDLQAELSLITLPPTKGRGNDCYEWIVEPKSKSDFPALLSALKGAEIINNISTYNKQYTNNDRNNLSSSSKNISSSIIILQKGSRDNDLFTIANALVKGGCQADMARQAIEILARNANPPFPENEIENKIKSALQRNNRRERNLTEAVREFVTLQDGFFDLSIIKQHLSLSIKEEQFLHCVIKRLCQEGIIKKYGEKRGQYIPVVAEEETVIDIYTADNSTMPLKLPLGITDFVKIMPKNIIVIAGEVNSGKTAFLLNVAAMNKKNHPVFYFSSEMGGAELKERLQNFPPERVPFESWRDCTFIERANDFDLVVRPDAINIIDFLEIHDEFYKIGGFIKKIFDRLNKGIAVIAIQKNPGRDEGLGGQRSLEKARLYLAMSPGKIKIAKAKNWVSSLINPNNMVKEYKLAKGVILTGASEWRYED